MSTATRDQLIAQLEKTRESRIITYLTSDREPFRAQIALDVLPLFYQALQTIGHTTKISLYLYSAGGTLDAPWPLTNLLREYCDQIEILVPFRALSAATLLALGADRIVMTPLSQLSPIDPEGTFITEGKPQNISVEDVASYIEFAKEKIGIAESQPLSDVLRLLTQEIKPSILGSLNRTHARIRRLGRNMLQLHLREPKHDIAITEIVNNLTQLLGSHNHLINRQEARDSIGFREMIEYANEETERFMQDLFASYSKDLELNHPFDPLKLLTENETSKDFVVHQAYIESREVSHVFETPLRVQVNQETHQFNVQPRGVASWHTRLHIQEIKK